MLKRWKPVESIDALGGEGVIAGELSGDPAVPDGLLTVNGVPTTREIEVRDRKTRRVVAVRRSNADGTYRFPGLNPALQYDVIARDFAGDFEDVIAGAVRPHTPDLLVPEAAGDKMTAFSDQFALKVVSLLHFDGADASTKFSDETGNVWTHSGNAKISTTQSKFGGSSAVFDGMGDDIRCSGSPKFNLGNSDFTSELFVRFASLANSPHILQIGQNLFRRAGLYCASGALRWYVENAGSAADRIVSTPLATNTWYHVAVAREFATTRLFINGALIGSTSAAPYNGDSDICLGFMQYGSAAGDYLNGCIDEFRHTKGVARYTANFTPPTAPFEL